jgi:hypothetical protein
LMEQRLQVACMSVMRYAQVKDDCAALLQ